MKLIHAHIENFGKLQDYDLDFTDGLNKAVYENGWGKSTLVAFIRVMLYGFENERKRSEVENERRRFEPWQGGTYGGTLVFEQDGKQYRIERVFEKGNDTFELYDNETNLPVDDYSENVGEELFGINRESFSKTVFVGQQDCSTEATSQINAKIGNISSETADMAMYDKAASALHNEQNRISARRATGELSKLRNLIAEKEAFIGSKSGLESRLENVAINMANCKNQLNEQDGVIRACDTKLAEAATKNKLLADKKEYATKKEEMVRAEQEFKGAQAKFPKAAPSLDEINNIITVSNNAHGLTQVAEETALSDKERKEYLGLQLKFKKGVPSQEQIREVEERIDQIDELRGEKQIGVLSEDELKKYSALERQFSLGVPREETIDELLSEWDMQNQWNNRLVGLKSQQDALVNRLRTIEASNRAEAEKKAKETYDAEKKTAVLIILAGLVVVLLGLFLYIIMQARWTLLIPLLGLAVAAYGYFWKKPKESMLQDVDYEGKDYENNPDLLRLGESIQEVNYRLAEIQEGRTKFITEYGFPPEKTEDIRWFTNLRDDVKTYNDLVERIHSQTDFQDTLKELTGPVFAFFEDYQVKSNLGDLKKDLFGLRNGISRLNTFKEKMNKQRITRNELEKDKLTVDSFLKKYALCSDEKDVDLTSLRDDVIALENAKASFEERKLAVDVFEASHDLQTIQLLEDYEESDISSIRETKDAAKLSYNSLEETMKEYVSDRDSLANSLQEIEEAEEELKALQEQEKELAWRQTIVNKTAEYLDEAKNNFLKKYLAPMQNAFDQYYELLSGEEADEYELDAQLNITKRANGKRRNVALLSEGYKDLVGLCRRMAMIDAMYENEKPFLIFDDPFVNLDDDKLECGMEFMKNVSKKYQVIYTTCHSSRTI